MKLCSHAKNTLLIIALMLSAVFMVIMLSYYGNSHIMIEYDCRVAEISPDFPDKVREMCREANRRDNYNV